MTVKDVLLVVIIPLALAEVGPWCGWLAARLLPWAAKLRYGKVERAAVRLEEWSSDLEEIPGQLTKLAYAIGQIAGGSAVFVQRKSKSYIQRKSEIVVRKTKAQGRTHPMYLRLNGPTLNPLLIAWRWRYEIGVVLGLSAGLSAAAISFGAVQTIIAFVGAVTATILTISCWPMARRFVISRVWCIITPHRVRVGCAQGAIFSSGGRIPIILLSSSQPFGERIYLWCRAGTTAEDLTYARGILAAACWAQDVVVSTHMSYAQMAAVDVIRWR